MINYITGKVVDSDVRSISVDIGSLCLTVRVPVSAQFPINESVSLCTYFHWNQEQGPSLFGFLTEADRAFFSIALSCSGLGPKIALALLADLGVVTSMYAITMGDCLKLATVNGIGKKKAEQIVMQLRYKIDSIRHLVKSTDKEHSRWHDISEALTALNYSRSEVTDAMSYVHTLSDASSISFDQAMRKALSFLSKKI